jgi:hypothetical protein
MARGRPRYRPLRQGKPTALRETHSAFRPAQRPITQNVRVVRPAASRIEKEDANHGQRRCLGHGPKREILLGHVLSVRTAFSCCLCRARWRPAKRRATVGARCVADTSCPLVEGTTVGSPLRAENGVRREIIVGTRVQEERAASGRAGSSEPKADPLAACLEREVNVVGTKFCRDDTPKSRT